MKPAVIIPTYNESGNIKDLTELLLSLGLDLSILFVDDNSPDGTGEIAKELSKRYQNIKVLLRSQKLGLGSAYIEGFKRILEDPDVDVIFQMDGDFSHDPAIIPEFLDAIKDSDVVIGSRYIKGVNVINWPMSRLILSYFANAYARFFTGLNIKDLTSGFKCYRRKVLETIDLDRIKSNGYAFQIESTFLCHKNRFRIKEIPIIFAERSEGSSKMSKGIVAEAFFMVLRLAIFRLFMRRRSSL